MSRGKITSRKKCFIYLIISVFVTAMFSAGLMVYMMQYNQSSAQNTIDNPLLGPTQKPRTPTVNDYVDFIQFSHGKTNNTLAYFLGFKDDTSNIYFLQFFYHYKTNDWYCSITDKKSGKESVGHGYATITYNSIFILLKGESLNITIYPSNISSIAKIMLGYKTITFKFEGKPFWYDDGKILSINKNEKAQGFEIIGHAIGTINKKSVVGYGTLEKLSFNIRIRDTPYFEDWVLFSTDKIGGLLYRQGEYRDGGIWINNEYYKPIDFLTTTLNYSYEDHYIVQMNKIVSLNINGTVKYLYLNMQGILKMDELELCKVEIIFDGTTYDGYSILDNALVT